MAETKVPYQVDGRRFARYLRLRDDPFACLSRQQQPA